MDVHPTTVLLQDLEQRLDFLQTEDDSTCGEISEYSVTMTILGDDPLSLMFVFWTESAVEVPVSLPQRLQSFVENDTAQSSYEDGFAWLSLYDLSGETAESIQQLLTEFAQALNNAGLVSPRGCVDCGREDTAELTLLEGRAVRLCPGCGDRLFEERDRREKELNRTSVRHGLAIPMACFYVVCGWAGFWTLLDHLLRLAKGVIWIDIFTVIMGICVFGAVGLVLGIPLGWTVRRGGLAQFSPKIVSVTVVALSVLFGEIFYIAISIFRIINVFDLDLALQMLRPVMQAYPAEWIIAKLLTTGAIAVGCHIAATAKKTVPLVQGRLRR